MRFNFQTSNKETNDFIQRKGVMPDGTKIQIEYWNPGFVIGAYPVAKRPGEYRLGRYYPEEGKTFRCHFEFDSLRQAEEIFEGLVNGNASLLGIMHRYYDGVVSKDILRKCLGK